MAEEAKNMAAPERAKDITEEKAAAPAPVPSPEKSEAVAVVQGAEKPTATDSSHERGAILTEKRMSLIKAWEESEKAKADNRAARRLASIASWERSKVAQMEAKLKKIHERLEMKKAERAEKLKNDAAAVRRAAEEGRAAAVARRGEEVVKAAAAAARYRDSGETPRRLFGIGLFGRLI